MRHFRLVTNLLFALLCVAFVSAKSYAEPQNLAALKEELHEYYQSGAYEKEIQEVADKANRYITEEAISNENAQHPKKLAIVLDIDETSLTYYPQIKKRQFAYIKDIAEQEILNADAPPIKPVLELYRNAINHKVAVFFVTGRPSHMYNATVKNLRYAGYTTWSGLYTVPDTYKEHSRRHFKTNTRCFIIKQGYTVIASIGDQQSDLIGGCAKRMFKLPNPFYLIT